jgi:hypothetical protein
MLLPEKVGVYDELKERIQYGDWKIDKVLTDVHRHMSRVPNSLPRTANSNTPGNRPSKK